MFKNISQTKKSKNKKKSWWVHLLSGLIIDEDAKHQKGMMQAIWLYLYLLIVANRKTGISYRKISTIEKETGFSFRSIQRWLKILRDNGYIKTKNDGRSLTISIIKWKSIIKQKKN